MRRDERGSALVELSWLGILLILPMLWIVMSVFEVQRGAFGVSAAARAAARAYALAPDDATGVVRAREAAHVALDDQGVHGVTPEIRISCTPYPGDCHQGGAVITVSVHSRVVLPLMPSALGGNRPSFSLDATQTVPIGQFQEVADAR
jgi:Flp pilus assembly protein TadG